MPLIHQSGKPTSVIKITPLSLPSHQFKQVDQVFRQMVADTGVLEIKKIMAQGIFKRPTGALMASMRGQVEGTAVVWWSDLPHAGPQEHGVKAHAMWYLLNKVIPIKAYGMGGQTTIFRRATLKSFMAGKWFHKGYPGKYFMKKGIEATVAKIPMLLQKAVEAVTKGSP